MAAEDGINVDSAPKTLSNLAKEIKSEKGTLKEAVEKTREAARLQSINEQIVAVDGQITDMTELADNLRTAHDEVGNTAVQAKDLKTTIKAELADIKTTAIDDPDVKEKLGVANIYDLRKDEKFQDFEEVKKINTDAATLIEQNKNIVNTKDKINDLTAKAIEGTVLSPNATPKEINDSLKERLEDLRVTRHELFFETPEGQAYLKTDEGKQLLKSKEGLRAAKLYVEKNIKEKMSKFDIDKDDLKNVDLISDDLLDIAETIGEETVLNVADDVISIYYPGNESTYKDTVRYQWYSKQEQKILADNPDVAAKLPEYLNSIQKLKLTGMSTLETSVYNPLTFRDTAELDFVKQAMNEYIKVGVSPDGTFYVNDSRLQQEYADLSKKRSELHRPESIKLRSEIIKETILAQQDALKVVNEKPKGLFNINAKKNEEEAAGISQKIAKLEEDKTKIFSEWEKVRKTGEKIRPHACDHIFRDVLKYDTNKLIIEPSLNGIGFADFVATVSDRYNHLVKEFEPQQELQSKLSSVQEKIKHYQNNI